MEETKEPVTQTEEKTEAVETETTEKTEKEEVKTFTQEEVNAMVAKATAKATKGMPNKDDLKAFNDWKESQKTETEKHAEIVKELEELKKENNLLKNQSVVANAGVDIKFQKFVLSEVTEMDGDFEDNLKSYLKDNQQFLITSSQSNDEAKNDTGIPVNKNNKIEESGVASILRQKHPDLFK